MRNELDFLDIINNKIKILILAYSPSLKEFKDFEILFNKDLRMYIIRYAIGSNLSDKYFQKAFETTLIESGLKINYAFVVSDPDPENKDIDLDFSDLPF